MANDESVQAQEWHEPDVIVVTSMMDVDNARTNTSSSSSLAQNFLTDNRYKKCFEKKKSLYYNLVVVHSIN
jgi:hypothetical protein